MRPRILVVAYDFPPHAAIGTQRALRLVSHLADRGWDIDVLTARPSAYLRGTPVDEQLLARIPSSARVLRTGALRGFTKLGHLIQPITALKRRTTKSVWLRNSPAPSLAPVDFGPAERPAGRIRQLKMLLEELCAMPDKEVGWVAPAVLQGLRSCATNRPDIIFSSAPPWSAHLVASTLANTLRCRWVADFRDPWVRSPWVRYKSALGVTIAARLEARIVRQAAAVIFTTRSARQEFAEYYGPQIAGRLHVVPNGCDPADFSSIQSQPPEDRFVLLHAGTLYGGRSPVALLRAIAAVRDQHPALVDRLRVRFLGSTGLSGVDIGRMCNALGISDIVELAPRVDRRTSLIEMRRASALLVIQPGTSMAIPAKFYEYLAAGRPILALAEEGEMVDLIRSHRLGVAAEPHDEKAIVRAIVDLVSRREPQAAPHISLFDGRLRASEMGAIIEAMMPPRVGVSRAGAAAEERSGA